MLYTIVLIMFVLVVGLAAVFSTVPSGGGFLVEFARPKRDLSPTILLILFWIGRLGDRVTSPFRGAGRYFGRAGGRPARGRPLNPPPTVLVFKDASSDPWLGLPGPLPRPYLIWPTSPCCRSPLTKTPRGVYKAHGKTEWLTACSVKKCGNCLMGVNVFGPGRFLSLCKYAVHFWLMGADWCWPPSPPGKGSGHLAGALAYERL